MESTTADDSASLAILTPDGEITSGSLDGRVIKFRYKWSIRNFGLRREKVGDRISAPAFLTDPLVRAKWRLDLYPRGERNEYTDYLGLHLLLLSPDPIDPECFSVTFAILNAQGDKMVNTMAERYVSQGRIVGWGWPRFVHRDLLLMGPKKEASPILMPRDILTILCEVTYKEDENTGKKAPDSVSLSGRSGSENGLDDFASLLDNPQFCDVRLLANGRVFHAHKAILAARSTEFALMLDDDTDEPVDYEEELHLKRTWMQSNNRYRIRGDRGKVEIFDLSADIVEQLLHYVYTGLLPKLRSHSKELLAAADAYGVVRMKNVTEISLARQITVSNATEILELADEHSADFLKASAIDYVSSHGPEVTRTTGWLKLIERRPQLIADLFKAMVTLPVGMDSREEIEDETGEPDGIPMTITTLNYAEQHAL